MDTILRKLLTKEKITNVDIASALYNICDSVHASCDSSCPIYAIHDGVPNEKKGPYGCDFFKNGEKMRKFLVKELKRDSIYTLAVI